MLLLIRLLLLLLLLITTVPSALFYVIRSTTTITNQHNQHRYNQKNNLIIRQQQLSLRKTIIIKSKQTKQSSIMLSSILPSSVASRNATREEFHNSNDNNNNEKSTTILKRIPIELIGATGRMGSQWLRMLHNDNTYIIYPVMRGIVIGSYNSNNNNNTNIPIIITTPSSIWESIYYQQTLYHRRCDLIFIGNGILYHNNNNNDKRKMMIKDVTYVVPHYAILKYGDSPIISTNTTTNTTSSMIPTYVYGKHSQFVSHTLRMKDNIKSIQIIDNPYEMYMIMLRKLLWSSCMWLLCHDPCPVTTNIKISTTSIIDDDVIPDHPRTVSQVHQYQSYQLHQLVNELLPQFHKLIVMQYNDDNDNDNNPEKQQSLISSLLLSSNDIIQYMETYSLSIPNAIPNKQLAMKEIYDRNGLFVAADSVLVEQPIHQQLIQRVAGIDLTNQLFHHNINHTNIHNDNHDVNDHTNNMQSNSSSCIMIEVDIDGIKTRIKDISSINYKNDVNDVSFTLSDHLTLLGRRRSRIIEKTNHDIKYEQEVPSSSLSQQHQQQQEKYKIARTIETIHDDITLTNNDKKKKNIVIIGGGIMGTSIALQIAKQKLSLKTNEDINIIVLDRLLSSSSSDNNNGLTTNASWGWINSNQKQPYHYHQLNELGMLLWKNDNHIKHLPIWNGSIVQNQKLISNNQLLLVSSKYPIVGPLSHQQLLQLEPNAGCGFNIMMESSSSSSSSYNNQSTQNENMTSTTISDDYDHLIIDPDQRDRQHLQENHHHDHRNRYTNTTDIHPPVYYFPSEGHVDPIEAVRTMKKTAKELGVEFRDDCNVTRIIYDDDDDDDDDNKNINRHDFNSKNISNKRYIRRIIGVEYETSRHDLYNDNITQLKQRLNADIVIVAAGIGTSTDMLGGIPLLHRPGTIAFFEKKKTALSTTTTEVASSMTSQINDHIKTNDHDRISNSMTKIRSSNFTLNHILVDTINQVHVLERKDGMIVAGGGYLQVGGLSPSLSSSVDMSMSPTTATATTMMKTTAINKKELDQDRLRPREEENEFVNRLLSSIKHLVPNSLNDLSFVSMASAIRPMPQDGLPAIGFNYRYGDEIDHDYYDNQSASSSSREAVIISNPLYIAVTHSGITLAPILSVLIAIEILHDIELDILQPYRPTRFRNKR